MTKKTKFVVPVLAAGVLSIALLVPRAVRAFDVNVQIGDDHHEHHEHRMSHEEIDAAIGHLNGARDALFKSGRDFGGYRVKALKSVDSAIKHCNEALAYANSHDR